MWTWLSFGLSVPALAFSYIGLFKRIPILTLIAGYTFWFLLFSCFMLNCAQISNHLFMLDICEQVREITIDFEFPQYGYGIGYFSSCLPQAANTEVVQLMYEAEIAADAQASTLGDSSWQAFETRLNNDASLGTAGAGLKAKQLIEAIYKLNDA